MTDTEDLLTMVYWIAGMVVVLFIIDRFWYKPFTERRKTEQLIAKLRVKNKAFYQTLPKFKAGRGIVVVISDTTIISGALLIITLRRSGCKLPVQVCYIGDDLNDRNRGYLEGIEGVSTKSLSYTLGEPLETLRGTQARVYSLVYSPFSEVLLLEPDMLFLQNPESLFNDPGYTQTGALFWRDRKVQSYWDKKTWSWVRQLIPYRKGDNRILDKKAGHYQSRDILLINKNRHTRTLEKLLVLTKANQTVYSYLPGDKESYWLAAELAKEPYAFVPSYPGVIGEQHLDTLCGHVLHLDTGGNLLGWNGSLFQNEDHRQITDFTHYSLFEGDAKWNNILNSGVCLGQVEHRELPAPTKEHINQYAKILHDIKNAVLMSDNPE